MELNPRFSRNVHHDGWLHQEAKAVPSPLQQHGYDPPTIDQSHDIKLLSRLLDRSHDCHGVCSEKILLWGLPGCGKRRIATEAALQFSARTGCKILWIEGRSFDCFVRDYRAAYTLITGENLPQGLTLAHTLLKTKATLESRRQEWLMVVFDLQPYLEEDLQTSLNTFNLFLPEWCRILVTSSFVISEPGGSLDQDEPMICGLNFARRATCLHVNTFNSDQTKKYLEAAGLDTQDLNFPAFQHKTSASIAAMRLVTSCAAMRLLNISASELYRQCLKKKSEGSTLVWPGYTPVFADTMAVLWDALNDYDTAPGRLLVICSVVDRRDIPVILVQQFPEFRHDEKRFSTAINILRLHGLIEISNKHGMDTINLHLLPYRWLQFKLKQIQEIHEQRTLVHSWITVMNNYLMKEDDQISPDEPMFRADRFWPMLGHISAICKMRVSEARKFCSQKCMKFLKQVGFLLAVDGLLPSLAGICITLAFNMCKLLQSRRSDDAELYRDYVDIRQIRALVYLKLSEYRQSEFELRDARRVILNHGLGGAAVKKEKLRQIREAEAHANVLQGRWPEASRILDELLSSPPEIDPGKAAQRQYWMAACKASLDDDVASLEHSHMSMAYWMALPEEEKWYSKDGTSLHWVEKHMFNLMALRKFKGALLLGRELLKRARDLTPILGQSVSRLSHRVVYCLCVLDKVSEAEKVVCELLEMPKPDKDLDDTSRAYLLHMLHDLAIAMQRNGRTVEAEGLCRFNISSIARYDVKSPDSMEKHDPWPQQRQLMTCLIEQGKFHEADQSAEEYQDEDLNEDYLKTILRNTRKTHNYLKTLYARAVEAEKAGTSVEFRASIDIHGSGPTLNRAVRLFGNIKRRIEKGHDFESDIDLHQLSRARRSRLLKLLDFPLVYLSFVDISPRGPLEPKSREHLWANRQQSVMEQYFKVCECRRKRRRSQSVLEPCNCVDYLRSDSDVGLKKLKQGLITAWITQTPCPDKNLPEGCSPSCPCREANQQGPAETAAWESKLLVWKEPVGELGKVKRTPRYRNPKPNRAPIPDDEMISLIRPNTWLWIQSEFASGDVEGENYIIPGATAIPWISITTPEEQEPDALPGFTVAEDSQEKMTKFYNPDYGADFQRVLDEEENRIYVPTRLDDILEDDEDDDDR